MNINLTSTFFKPISFKQQFINSNHKNDKPILIRELKADTVSFTAYKPKALVDEIELLGENIIPVPVLKRAKELIATGKDMGINLFHIHGEYYNALKNAKTLGEVKGIYPEFLNVIELNKINPDKIRNTTVKQIFNGEYAGITPENASLMILKKVYCKTDPEALKSLSWGRYSKLKEVIQVPKFDKRYSTYLQAHQKHLDPKFKADASQRMKLQRQNADFNEKGVKAANKARKDMDLYNDPGYIAKRNEGIAKLNQDPAYIAKRDASLAKARKELEKPEVQAKHLVSVKARHKDPKYAAIHRRASSVSSIEMWAARPDELKNVHKEFAKDYPHLGPILEKQRKGQKLTESDLSYLNLYFNRLYKEHPEILEHLSKHKGKAYSDAYWQAKADYEMAEKEGRLEELLEFWKESRRQ